MKHSRQLEVQCDGRIVQYSSSMERPTGRKELPTIADRPLCCHTTHYERFFMLCVDLHVNGEKAELSGANSRKLILSPPNKQSWQISSEGFLNAANEAGKKYGIDHLAKLRCGHLPMMEVEFVGTKDITEFLQSLSEGKFQECLEIHLRKLLTTPEISSVSLDVSLHLVVPLPDCDASVTKVTLDNLKSSLQTLKEGNQFKYKIVMTKDPTASDKKGMVFLFLSLNIYIYI